MKIAIIGGTGKMGRWFARFLSEDGKEVVVVGRDQRKLLEIKQELGVEVATGAQVVKDADVVLLSVPINSFEEVVEQVSPYIHSGQVIIDVTSVKVFPVEVMHKHLKARLVLGAHPMFGPGATKITNHNFVLTPTNDAERTFAEKVKGYLETRGARAVLMTPEKHDAMASVVLGLSHFVALVAADTLLSLDGREGMEAVSGISYKVLLMLAKSVALEDPELYTSLQMSLPDIVAIETLFLERAQIWADLVRNREERNLMRKVDELAKRLREETIDFDTAYGSMYTLVESL